jgi:hypothetical protein
MAKLTGPLLSVNAHGTVADVLTFSKRSSGNQVRYQRAQKDYENAARKIARDAFRNALLLWNALTAAEKAYWNEIESKGYADV